MDAVANLRRSHADQSRVLAGRGRRMRHATACVVVAVLGSFVPSTAHAAAPAFGSTRLEASVVGSSVTLSTVVTAAAQVNVGALGICVRDARNQNRDLPKNPATVQPGGTPFSASGRFETGTYSYFACVRQADRWYVAGGVKYFTVGMSTDLAMPRGDVGPWKQVYAEDFTTTAPLGSFLSSRYGREMYPYSDDWDTFGHGRYDAGRVNSVHDGMLDWYLHRENGQSYVSGLVIRHPRTNWGSTYGRYSVKFRSEQVTGYKMAFLLWPDSENWGDGEIDFPEARGLDATGATIYANHFAPGAPGSRTPGENTGFTTNVHPANTGWHIATTEWSPGNLTYYLDGIKLGTKTNGVPTVPMHWVLQVETSKTGPVAGSDASGHLQVDWATMYDYAPR